ncbi:MAG: formimidoylglutamase [Desulfovermiculus sp.]|nr:formimidoylglutamase [Desulfovermiculus sp.]
MLRLFDPDQRREIVAHRLGEQKVGETVSIIEEIHELQTSSAQFVIFGVCEDIGIRANLGSPGAASAWNSFIPAFVNLQDNQFLRGNNIIILGYLNFANYMAQAEDLDLSQEEDLNHMRTMCEEIDSQVCSVVQKIVASDKVPILIGGGHNNALGAMRGWNLATNKRLSIINIDRHADFRSLEGRHSGNAFHYAWKQGYMHRYAVFGLDESYTNQYILDQFHQNDSLAYVSFDQLLSCSEKELVDTFEDVLHWLKPFSVGLEVDMDSVGYFPASATTPSGLTLNELRKLIKIVSAHNHPVYFHLSEASPAMAGSKTERDLLGKALSLLTADFIKSHPNIAARL